MIEVGIVDLSAESRRRLGALVEKWAWAGSDARSATFPQLSTHLLSPEEVRFHGAIELCIVGPELLNSDAAYITTLRRALPDQIVICVLDSRSYSFGMIEQLGRLGVDDVLTDTASSDEFFRRLLLLTRKVAQKKSGEVVLVDAIKGGAGATFIAAGLAESFLNQGKRVCVVDTDVVTQDLTRYLGNRPFVNEPLKILLDQQRVVTSETVKECVFQVWEDEARFFCMPPAAACDQGVFASPHGMRTFLAILDTLKGQFDAVILDGSSLVASARQTLAQIAQHIYLVVDRDPAAAYANRHALTVITGCCRLSTSLTAVVNDTKRGGLPLHTLRDEVLVAGERDVRIVEVPHVARAGRWACTGATPAQFLPHYFKRLLPEAVKAEKIPSAGERSVKDSVGLFSGIRGFLSGVARRRDSSRADTQARGRAAVSESLSSREAPGPGGYLPSHLNGELPLDPSGAELVSKPTLAGIQ